MDDSMEQAVSIDGSVAPASSSEAAPPADSRRVVEIWSVCGVLLLLVAAVFGQTLGHEFLNFDDDVFVSKNPHVTAGLTWDGIRWAFTEGPLGEWYPLAPISQMLDCQLYGLEPAGHFLTNVLLHAASSVLLFLVLLRMTGQRGSSATPASVAGHQPQAGHGKSERRETSRQRGSSATTTLWPSAWVAAVFAVHPLHVESVAWLAERRDVLSGLFFMLTLGAYTFYSERPSLLRYLAVAGFFALGLMSKPMLVTVPAVLMLLDYWPLGRLARSGSVWRLVLEKVPLVALAVGGCAMVFLTHQALKATGFVDQRSLGDRLGNAVVAYVAYLGQSFWPVNLSAFYPYRGGLPVVAVAGGTALLLAITAAAVYFFRRLPYFVVGWFWFLGMLVPVIGLVSFAPHARADRYTYLPQIGLAIAVAWGAWEACSAWRAPVALWWRWTLGVLASTSVLILAAVAFRQTMFWSDAETLWTHSIACTEPNAIAQYALAVAYGRESRYADAVPHLVEAIAIGSDDRAQAAYFHFYLGECYANLGDAAAAAAEYEKAVALYPTSARCRAGLASALARVGKTEPAFAQWREAIRLQPGFVQAKLDLARALFDDGRFSEAATECSELLRMRPNWDLATSLLGRAMIAQGQLDTGIPLVEQAVAFDPKNAELQFCLGMALVELGERQNALAHLTEALRLAPQDVPMLWQTAWLLATSADPSIRDGARALQLATKAVQKSDGRAPHAFDAQAAALAETENFEGAVAAAERGSALALTQGDTALADAIDARIRLYRQGTAYHQPASSVPKLDGAAAQPAE